MAHRRSDNRGPTVISCTCIGITLSSCLVHLLLNSYIVFVVLTETTSITQEDVVTQPSGSASENQNQLLKGSE